MKVWDTQTGQEVFALKDSTAGHHVGFTPMVNASPAQRSRDGEGVGYTDRP